MGNNRRTMMFTIDSSQDNSTLNNMTSNLKIDVSPLMAENVIIVIK